MTNEPSEYMLSPGGTTWKRTYVVDRPADLAKNEILTSEEILAKEQFEIDLLKASHSRFLQIEFPL
jgi:hypothetical protein